MSDSAREGAAPESAPASTESLSSSTTEQPSLPHWSVLAQKQDWVRAYNAAHLAGEPTTLCSVLEILSALQTDLRARSYASAKRALTAYEQALVELQQTYTSQAEELRALVHPKALEPALEALQKNLREVDIDVVQNMLTPALQVPLTKADAFNALGVIYAVHEDSNQAREYFHQAIALDAEHYRARMNLGNLLLESGNAAAAEAEYQQVLKIAPEYEGLHHNLGVALRRQGKMYQSVGAIRRAQRLTLRRSREQSKAEVQEQLRTNPKLRMVRNIFFAVVGIILLWIFFGPK